MEIGWLTDFFLLSLAAGSLKQMIKKLLIFFTVLLLLVVLAAGGALYWFVVLEPGEEISEDHIHHILGRESPVFYNDGETILGSFFSEARRKYVAYDEIPETFVNALVAAEDNRFFSHFGFDVQGIVRAAIKNIEAGRVVQGGSTLTQQTAKNLFKRKDRSYKAKFIELIYALRLEYRYSKEQILEFYANQFYVYGNGHGLGVAARYYFDKEPAELNLVESAYIAGSVKRPNYYNPFIKKTPETVMQAKERGRQRAGYVLSSMKNLGMISEADYREAINTDIPFDKGTVGYSLDYVMELVTEAVASERVLEALSVHGIDNIATSGIRIITTVDQQIQQRTMYGLRKQLSTLDVRLRGYEREAVQKELQNTDYRGDLSIETGNFVFGTITAIDHSDAGITIDVDTGLENGVGIIDQKGLQTMVEARVKWQKNRWTEPQKSDFNKLLEQLEEGDRVWVSVREIDEFMTPIFDLERFPEIQGGAIVLHEGTIISVSGGVENRFFNRAMYGQRTMGSSYKPFVYAAALQLGWNAVDLLPNRRDIFVFQNQAYFPRPDHEIDSEQVSMSWAGVRSENLATVWLAAHLCDNLSSSQFRDVASHLGLAPRTVENEPEPYRLFRSRIRDRYGIVMNDDMVRQAAFRSVTTTIEPDLVFEGLASEYALIERMHYGLNFAQYRQDIDREMSANGLKSYEIEELRLRKKLLRNNFLDVASLYRQLRSYLGLDSWGASPSDQTQTDSPGSRAYLYFDPLTSEYVFTNPVYAADHLQIVSPGQFMQDIDIFNKAESIGAIRLGSSLSVKGFEFLQKQVESEYQKLSANLPYAMEVLEEVEDYRILVGLTYLTAFGSFLGIESELEPILSFPLGSNVTTLIETTRVYEALVSGKLTLFPGDNGDINNTFAIIDRIESEEGAVLYRPDKQTRRAVSARTSLVLGHILENTVKFGTGRYADANVKLTASENKDGTVLNDLSLSIPLLGKTGTANRYTNASFFGYLPVPNEQGTAMELNSGYGIGVYVGYDNNMPMRRGSTRITGSAGALPAWTEIAKAIIRNREFTERLDPVDLSFSGLAIDRKDLGQKNYAVLKDYGGRLEIPLKEIDPIERYQPSIITFGAADGPLRFSPDRSYSPFWLNRVPASGASAATALPEAQQEEEQLN